MSNNRLSNRYLSHDSFTSSKGKMSSRIMFSRKNMYNKKFALFEFRNILLKIFLFVCCGALILYTVPFFRYKTHYFFTKVFYAGDSIDIDIDIDIVNNNMSYFVSPIFGKTDRFFVQDRNNVLNTNMYAYAYSKEFNTHIPVGVISTSSSSKPELILFSDIYQKNILFVKDKTLSDSDEGVDPLYINIDFDGFGYGQLHTQITAQTILDIGDVIYSRTEKGLLPVAQVIHLEKDTGSTFTHVYGRLLISPTALYKIRTDI